MYIVSMGSSIQLSALLMMTKPAELTDGGELLVI